MLVTGNLLHHLHAVFAAFLLHLQKAVQLSSVLTRDSSWARSIMSMARAFLLNMASPDLPP